MADAFTETEAEGIIGAVTMAGTGAAAAREAEEKELVATCPGGCDKSGSGKGIR